MYIWVWLDWGKLVDQGRAKAIWISWNEQESKARYINNIPADYVRQWILTKKDYQENIWKIKLNKKSDLLLEAQNLWIPVTNDASISDLKNFIDMEENKRNMEIEAKESKEKLKNEAELKLKDRERSERIWICNKLKEKWVSFFPWWKIEKLREVLAEAEDREYDDNEPEIKEETKIETETEIEVKEDKIKEEEKK